jgi:hypothetical protein
MSPPPPPPTEPRGRYVIVERPPSKPSPGRQQPSRRAYSAGFASPPGLRAYKAYRAYTKISRQRVLHFVGLNDEVWYELVTGRVHPRVVSASLL